MFSLIDPLPETPGRELSLSWYWELGAVGLGLGTLALGWATSGSQPPPSPEAGTGLYAISMGAGIAVFSLLYVALSLLSYRTSGGVYAGFQHLATLSAYLTLGPLGATATCFIGSALTEAGCVVLRRRVHDKPLSIRAALASFLFNAGLQGYAVLIAGTIYLTIGGKLLTPVTAIDNGMVLRLLVLFAADIVLYHLPVLLIMRQSQQEAEESSALRGTMVTLVAADVFPLPVSVLLAIAYYELSPVAFLILVGATVASAALFRVNAESRRNLERHVIELATLNSIGQSISSSLDQNDLMRAIYEQVTRLMAAPTFYIALYDSESHLLTFPLAIQDGERVEWQPKENMTGPHEAILRTRQAVLLAGDRARGLGGGQPAACYLGVPMITPEEVLGIIAVQHPTQEHAYGPKEVTLLTTVAAQAAAALRNSNLFSRVWEMADRLALLNNVSSVVTETLDLDTVLKTTCEVVIQMGEADKTAIFLTSDDGSTLRLAHHIGLSPDYVAQFTQIERSSGSGPAQAILETVTQAISDVRTDPRGRGWRSLAEIEGYIGLLTVPLSASKGVIGFLAAFYQWPHTFTKSELDLMNTLANQVAVTVANVRLFQDVQSRAQELTQLVDASRVFTSTLELGRVARTVMEELERVLVPTGIAVMALEVKADSHGIEHESDRELHALAQNGFDHMQTLTPIGSITTAIATCTTLTLPYSNNSEDRALLRHLNLQRMYVMPLVSEGRSIGAVLAGYVTERELTSRQRQLAEALGNQAATALRNAQLFQITDLELERNLREISAIEKISREISGTLDLEIIVSDVLETAMSISQCDLAGFALVADSDNMIYVIRCKDPNISLPEREVIGRNVGVIGEVMRSGATARIDDVRLGPSYYIEHLPSIRSELCVPIERNEDRVGVINLESYQTDAFNANHARFLNNLAKHAAIAVENARLFEARQRQIATLIQFRNFSLEILSATTLPAVLDRIVECAMTVAQARRVELYLYDRTDDALTFGAGQEGQFSETTSTKASIPPRGSAIWNVALSGQSHLTEKITGLQPAMLLHYDQQCDAVATIPLKIVGSIVGVLSVQFRNPRFYTENEIHALELLANQAAIAIQNTRLFDAVRTEHDRMQVILDSTRDGMALIDADNKLVGVNQAATRLLNFPMQLHIGQNIFRAIAREYRDAKDVKEFNALWKDLHILIGEIRRDPNKVTRRIFQVRLPNGFRDIEESTLPVRNASGDVSGRLLVFRDISEEKSLERFRDEVTSMMIHDLRAPLSGVISSLRLVQEMVITSDFADLDKVVSIALNSSESQMRMIESLLEIAKLETGQLPLKLSAWSIKAPVTAAITAMEAVAHEASVNVKDCVPNDLPKLRADEDQIRRVLVNLLDNALRHTPANGEVRIEAFPMSRLNNGRAFAQIGVIDTGKGIPVEYRESIFTKFVQVPKSALRGHRGSGLGLTFCKQAIETHGGRIWVDSGPEGGAAFWFTLPIVQGNELEPPLPGLANPLEPDIDQPSGE